MRILIVDRPLSAVELNSLAADNYGTMVKGVVDVRKRILALGGELHADAEQLLLQNDSSQADLWGFNLHMGVSREDRLEYTSFINIRPKQGNRSLEIRDPALRQQIREIVDGLVE